MSARSIHMAAALLLAAAAACSQPAFRSRKTAAGRSILQSPMPFRALGLPGGNGELRVRASADGVHWTAWETAQPDGEAGALVFFGNLNKYVETDAPSEVTLLFIDPGVTPAGEAIARPRDAFPAPPIVTRDQWGCTPDACPVTSPPSYSTVTHLIVHHTDMANDATDWAAVVRSIWVLHVQGNGWSDIGYNYLVDPNGMLYEGRAGGDGVIGAHFSCVNSGTMGVALMGTYSVLPVPAPALDMLRRMLAWQAAKWNLDPTGKQRHAASGLMLDTVSGHRDANFSAAACGSTECPGNGAYTDLAGLRTEVGSLLAGACPAAVSERSLCVPAEGGTLSTSVTAPAACPWQASGGADWIAAQANGGRLDLTVQSNSGGRRSGMVTAGGHTITISQSAKGEGPLPCVAFNGIVSAAGDSGRPVVAGSVISIYGSNLAAQQAAADSLALPPAALGGVSVTVDGRAAPLIYVSPTQINAQLPAATGIGSGQVTVTANGVAGSTVPISVTEAVPAIFGDGTRAVAAPVPAGGSLRIYVTGVTASLPVTASIAGRPARVVSLTPVAGIAGVFALDLLVPADTPAGDQPVMITVSGTASTPALITVEPG